MRNFREYTMWQLSQEVAKDVYLLTDKFDSDEKFGITSQLRRAVVSISSNIAEGCSRSSERDFGRFLEISIGSAFEVESILTLCAKLGKVEDQEIQVIIEKLTVVEKQINTLRSKLLK